MKTARDILQRAEETLFSASLGLDLAKSSLPKTKMAGLRNVAVFGRAVTNVLQNLKSIAPGFVDWYEPHVEAMSNDEAMKFFYKIRSEILKEGSLKTASTVTLSGNPMALMKQFEAPPNAKSFFIGDYMGGCGWQIETSDGTLEKYYVEFPAEVPGLSIDIKVHFADAPGLLVERSVDELCAEYLGKLRALVDEAKARFS